MSVGPVGLWKRVGLDRAFGGPSENSPATDSHAPGSEAHPGCGNMAAPGTPVERRLPVADGRRSVDTHGSRRAAVRSVTFSPDGKLLASGSHDKTIGIWKTETDGRHRILTGHGGPVGGAPDGKLVASGSDNKTVGLWDPAAGEVLKHITHVAEGEKICFDATGSHLITNYGGVPLNLEFKVSDKNTLRMQPSLPENWLRMYGVSSDCSWITWGGHNIGCLPPVCKNGAVVVWHAAEPSKTSKLAMGCRLGRDILVCFCGAPSALRVNTAAVPLNVTKGGGSQLRGLLPSSAVELGGETGPDARLEAFGVLLQTVEANQLGAWPIAATLTLSVCAVGEKAARAHVLRLTADLSVANLADDHDGTGLKAASHLLLVHRVRRVSRRKTENAVKKAVTENALSPLSTPAN
ncbi:hypothetical protein Purlil1_12893 [Purpureocillium lilacinum]|uniref:Mitochondrial division protein 1 n=1 Tax=Purpureocillium lilacinum TaxID=33203 RepID=A0ABR0BFU3_PURLI|nr:hypothetical protein Purlil1_12893 [Purpureocillium lilacinum]